MTGVIGEAVQSNVVRGVIAAEHLAFALSASSIDGLRLVQILRPDRLENNILDVGKRDTINLGNEGDDKDENFHGPAIVSF